MNARISTVLFAIVAGLAALTLPGAGVAASVGYYEMCTGAGSASAATAITTAGHTPVNVNIPDATTLNSLDALFVTNCSNSGYGSEYFANLAAINNAVQTQGLVLIIHDRYVSGAGTILPGVIGVRDFSDEANINFPVGSPILTGPGGTLTASSLDGGNSSSHGYVAAGTLPAGGQVLAHRTAATEGVTVTYPWGTGRVVYSTIPLDFYFNGANPASFRTIYAPNIIAWGTPHFTTCAAEGYRGTKLTLCKQVCEMNYPPTTVNALIKAWRTLYRTDPPCAN